MTIETLHPGVYVIEEEGTPALGGTSTGTAGFVGVAEKGPIDKAVLVTSLAQYNTYFGGMTSGSMLQPAVKNFFDQGGRRCWIARVVHAGVGAPTTGNVVITNHDVTGSSGVARSGAEPFNLEPGQTLTVAVDGGAAGAPVTFTATAAEQTGSVDASSGLNFSGTDSIEIKFDDFDTKTVTFSAGAPLPLADILQEINDVVVGGRAVDDGSGYVQLISDSRGTGSSVYVGAGAAIAILGFTSDTSSAGAGNVENIDSVTADEVASIIGTQAGAEPAVAIDGRVEVISSTTGATSSIQIGGTATYVSVGDPRTGFDTSVHSGSDATYFDAISVDAANPGAWANTVSVKTQVWTASTTGTVINGQTVIALNTIRGASRGDVIHLYDPSNTSNQYVGLVRSINSGAKTITVYPAVSGLGGTLPISSTVASSSMHRMSTLSSQDLEDGATSLAVEQVQGLQIGAAVVVIDSAGIVAPVEFFVTGIDGNSIRFDAITTASPITSGAVVASLEFGLKVYERNQYKESHEYLSMSTLDTADYVENRLSGYSTQSQTIAVEDLLPATATEWKKLPLPEAQAPMVGGSDGTAPDDNDYIGSDSSPKSGMYLLDEVVLLDFFAIPGIGWNTVQSEMETFAERKGSIAIFDSPIDAELPDDIYDYVRYELNVDSSYAAMYYPWVEIRDPRFSDRKLLVPPSGFVAGEYAYVSSNRGIQYPPANDPLNGAIGLAYYVGDSEQDILNPVGINCLRSLPGQGIRIYGARTLWSVQDGKHYVNTRRILNMIARDVKNGFQWVALREVNDPRLWKKIELVGGRYLRGLWSQGVLYPSTDAEQAYFIKCDSETNPLSEIKLGRLTTEIGVNTPTTVEFVIFKLSLWDGGASVEVG